MLSILYCQDCQEKLRAYGEYVSDLYDVVLYDYLVNDIVSYFFLTDKDANKLGIAINFLEDRGYIVSTETSFDCISVKPLGIRCYEEREDCFCHICFKPDEHNDTDMDQQNNDTAL
jgi:hypothetical protein